MRTVLLIVAALCLIVSTGGQANRAAAMVPASRPATVEAAAPGDGRWQEVRWVRRYAGRWAPRHYWQWDARPIWDDPWVVLRPTIWGSPEPHLVPADIWACEWRLPGLGYWRRHWRCHSRR